MATIQNITPAAVREPAFRVAHLFRDPILRAVFAAAERDSGAAFVIAEPRPPVLAGGAARVLEDA